jgi:hypothetical protein
MVYKILANLMILACMQSDVQVKSKYASSFDYIKNTAELQNEILSNLRLNKNQSAIPGLSDSIIYSGIFAFSNIPDSSKIQLSRDERNYFPFDKKYYFETYTDSSLKEIESPSGSGLVLYFSRPVHNFLIASIYIKSGFGSHIRVYFGDAAKILFVFDEANNVVETIVRHVVSG